MVRRTGHVLALLGAAATLILTPVAHAAEPAGAAVHVVEPGDTLWQIAFDAGVDAAAVAQLNGLNEGDLLSVGQSLKLPAVAGSSSAAPPVVAAPAASKYTVADGDTLWSIAQQLNTTTDALVTANQLDDADKLSAGQVLTVPSSGGASASARSAASSTAAAAPAPAPSAPPATAPRASATASSKRLLVPYTVQPGETLGGIARQFEVTVDGIAQATGIDDPNRIRVGSVVKVPLPGYEHEVVAGETLRDIAAHERVDLGSLIDFNDIQDPELIRIGQIVLVPAVAPGQQAAALSASAPAAATAPAPAPALATASAPAPALATASAPAPAPKPANPAPPAPAAPAAKPAPAPAPPKPLPAMAPPAGAPSDGVPGAALKLLGAPYVWGGSSPGGFDCSGFVWYAVRQAGKSIGRGMLGEYNAGAHPGRDELKAGDLVFFQNTYTAGLSHNGIYIGNGQFVHAADEQSGVTVSSLSSSYWSSHWFGATRLP